MTARSWDEAVRRARRVALEADLRVGADPSKDPAPSVAWLESAVDWIARCAPSWEAMSGVVPQERSYRRIFVAPALEAWLICWPSGGRLQLHDHGGASGAFEVIDGVLDESALEGGALPDGSLSAVGAPIGHRRVPTGGVVAFDGRYIHDVRNSSSRAATSVHIYSAAQRPMGFYGSDGELVGTVEVGDGGSLVEAEVTAESAAR